ncbi:LuxR family transcriptional regulator [Desulforamulus reducens MI-1]|uniref:LuxR family transcriptional regulator n=1 Tax=Desulforamulus reducens (strain ATCC BAA-1160 / DSM 100696 / MI-1) TaxID=349161 RepID=A4J5L0_DESRM|nr:GIY-YIG nuclease family protein [Desulforamulus reducens]ABO50363.1 LuxR family transcriptional regulator [Desulforamulus reducens MI-1]
MDRRKELKQQYKQMKTEGGVYQIKNTKNQKVLVIATPNLKTMIGRKVELRGGGHKNKQLQEDWNTFGEEAFVFEVLEVLEEKEEGFFDKADELKKLEKKWLEKLQPFGEHGYNKISKREQAK